MQSNTTTLSGRVDGFCPTTHCVKRVQARCFTLNVRNEFGKRTRYQAPVIRAPFRSGHPRRRSVKNSVSRIIAEVLNEEQKRGKPASLLELLDRQGWGVRADITRKFSTKFASVTLEASWDDEPRAGGRVESRRLALLAVYQEWLVARSLLLGRVVEEAARLRPGYMPAETLERVRAARASGALLSPETESLDGPSLLRLACLVLPQQQLVEQLDGVLEETRREVLAAPSYRGRDDLLPSLERGLLLLRASVVRTIALNAFRAAHVDEVLALEAELRRQQRLKRDKREDPGSGGGGLMGMWFRESRPAAATAPGAAAVSGEAAANSASTRLYGGQLAADVPRWMAPGDRAAAAAAPAGRIGPRGLRAGRCGEASFRPFAGALLCGDPGRSGCGSFGGTSRLAFNQLDAAVGDLMAKADFEVPAAAMAAFARLHRTALVDALSQWQWRRMEAAGGPDLAAFYQPSCSHAAAIRPPGPLLVGRRTRLEVAPGPELDSLRSLVRRRGSEVLAVVHPLARKQVVRQGEWEYWREAYRLWDRFAPMPPSCRSASLTLTLTADQVPYVGLLEAEAAGRAAAAANASAAALVAAEDLDMSSLTSMSSLDFDDAPLPAGVAAAAAAAATGVAGGSGGGSGSAAAGTSAANSAGDAGGAAVQTETTVEISVPPAELRRFLMAVLELLPSHVGDAAAAAASAALAASSSVGPQAPPSPPPAKGARSAASAAAAAAAARTVGEWLPAGATALQIRYSPAPTSTAAARGSAAGASSPAAGGTAPGGGAAAASASASPKIPEELEPSCYELRWAQGSATVTTLPSGPAASSSFSRIAIPQRGSLGATQFLAPYLSSRGIGGTAAAAGGGGAVRWCAPMRLTQAQLLSLVNIFTDVAQQVPDTYGIQPPRLVVPTLSPLERLVSAAQGVAGSVARAAGLLALLAVPLAAAIKAGGGDLNAVMAATPGARPAGRLAAPAAVRDAAAAVGPALAPRSVASAGAGCEVGAAGAAPAAATSSAVDVAPRSTAAAAAAPRRISVGQLVAVCREVEARLEGRMWLEVTGTAAAAATAVGSSQRTTPVETGDDRTQEWPQFQLVVERRSETAAAGGSADGGGGGGVSVRVLGCRPVNSSGRAVYGELPLAAALRGPAAEAATAAHLTALTPERIGKGKATPGRFDTPYRSAVYQRIPENAALAVAADPPAPAPAPSAARPGASAAAAAEADMLADPAEGSTTSFGAAVGSAASAPEPNEAEASRTGGAEESAEARPSASSDGSTSAKHIASLSGRRSADAAVTEPGADAGGVSSSAGPAVDIAGGVSAVGVLAESESTAAVPSSSSPPAPALSASSDSSSSSSSSATATAAAARTDSAAAAAPSLLVLKLELLPSPDPGRHVVQGRGAKQREFAQTDVVVRPWYDSDSLLSWLEGGVQLPELREEIQRGLLAEEERQRAAFLAEYERVMGWRPAEVEAEGAEATAAAASEEGSPEAQAQAEGAAADGAPEGLPGPRPGEELVGAVAGGEGSSAREAAGGASSGGGGGGGGGVGGAAGAVLQPQQLSEQQLQEALQQLFSSLGVPKGAVRLSSAAGGPSGNAGGAPRSQ